MRRPGAGAGRLPARIRPGEWIEISHVAVQTRSVLTAARVAARVKRVRARGTVDGIAWMGLGAFRALLDRQSAPARAPRRPAAK